jgi:hypothetical protein
MIRVCSLGDPGHPSNSSLSDASCRSLDEVAIWVTTTHSDLNRSLEQGSVTRRASSCQVNLCLSTTNRGNEYRAVGKALEGLNAVAQLSSSSAFRQVGAGWECEPALKLCICNQERDHANVKSDHTDYVLAILGLLLHLSLVRTAMLILPILWLTRRKACEPCARSYSS